MVKREWAQNLCSRRTSIPDRFDSIVTRRSFRADSNLAEISTPIQPRCPRILAENFLQLIKKLPVPSE